MGLSTASPAPHGHRARSSDDVSIAFLCVLLVGFVLWLAYGIALSNPALIVSNTVAIATYAITTVGVLRFRRP